MSQQTDTAVIEEELRERGRRYLKLRSAERAISEATRFSEFLLAATNAREISERISERMRRIGEGQPGADGGIAIELEMIDTLLGRYTRALHEVVDRTPLARLRATLPSAIQNTPDEVTDLLDFCLEDQGIALRRLDLLDYLITTLCTEQRDGLRVVSRNPAELTPKLA